MAGLRTYGDPCGIARALDIVGERWALLIVRELVFGPKRFTDLRRGLAGASPNVLSQRLRELESAGVVRRRTVGAATYELTERGHALHPILVQLGLWGARASVAPPGELSAAALMVALETSFDTTRAPELDATYLVRLDEDPFTVEIERGTIAIARGTLRRPDATIATDPATLRSLVFGGRKLADAPVELTGDTRLARTFLRLFPRP